jgi:hypothetical protein
MAAAMVGVMAAVLVTGVSMGAPPGAAADPVAPAAQCEELAGRLRIEPGLEPTVIDLCRRSSRFRRQMARLTGIGGLAVTVRQVVYPPTSSWRAQAAITRVGGRLRSADVRVQPGTTRQLAELIAHEFEHILEQLDGVDLQRWVGHSGVRRIGPDAADSPIETERARQVGRLVAGEYAAATAEITAFKGW